MRLRIQHEIRSSFESPILHAVREIRLTPRTFEGQYVGDWRLDVDNDCRLDRVLDGYGNVVHDFSLTGPIRELNISGAGEVEVDDNAGVLPAGALDRIPAGVFLRETRLTRADSDLTDLASDVAAKAGANPLDRCHGLMAALQERLDWGSSETEEKIGAATSPAEAVFAAGKAGPAGTAHVFIAVARAMRIPARYVSGYLWRGDDRDAEDAIHAWAEALVPGLGWVGFDVQNERCPTDAYVRVSIGLDQHGAAWIRGADHGNPDAHVSCRASITRVEF